MKKWIQQLFCKHDYWFRYEATWSNSQGNLDHDLMEIEVMCKKCGKIHTVQYKKITY